MNAKEFLKHNRKMLGLTQAQLAKLSGYNAQMIADYETGRARVPGDLVLKIQDLLWEKGEE